MPFFKSTYNILTKPWEDEVWNDNWMDSDKIVLPPKRDWDYSRELTIEDVDLWEVVYQRGGGTGVYAAWSPYAEFYMITDRFHTSHNDPHIQTFYGPGALEKVKLVMKQKQIPFVTNDYWVDDENMWLYDPLYKPMPSTLILP